MQLPMQKQPKSASRFGLFAFLLRELQHVAANRRVVGLLAGMTLLPALFVLIQVSSAWNPNGNLEKLPVGLVVLDKGTTFGGQHIDLGAEVKKNLLDKHAFGYKTYRSEAEVEQAVDRGEVYFAAVLPADFSAKAMRGEVSAQAPIELLTSEGSSYFASTVGKRFGVTLADTVNQTLEEKRWATVLKGTSSAQSGLAQLRQGIGKLRDGAGQLLDGATALETGSARLSGGLQKASSGSVQLATGAQGLSSGVSKLTGGVEQLATGVRTMAAQLPNAAKLEQLGSGAAQLKNGSSQLAAGLDKLAAGGATLLHNSQQLAAGLGQLEGGSSQLVSGSAQLQTGLDELASGTATLGQKSGELAAGTAKLNAVNLGGPNSPLSQGLHQINEGAAALNQGILNVAKGTVQANQGTTQLNQGAIQLQAGLSKAADGSQKLVAGTAQLSSGANTAAEHSHKLAVGAASLATGVQTLTRGMAQLSSGITQMNAKLPAQSQLEQLNNGAQTLAEKSGQLSSGLVGLNQGGEKVSSGATQLKAGAEQLVSGLNLVYQKIPSGGRSLSGDPQGLAASVKSDEQILHPVGNNGMALAPLFAGFSLWLGVMILTMLFNFTHLPEAAKGQNQMAKVLVKLATPALIVTIQALVIGALVAYMANAAGKPVADPLALFVVLILGAQAFIAVAAAIMMLLGGPGRALVSLLLILQFVSAGGNFPIELSPPFFQAIHPWLPVTHLLEAMRAALFGAYGGDWGHQALVLLAFTLGGLAVATLAGRRWQYVRDEEYRLEPALLN